MSDFLAEKRREINDRMQEIRPLVNEYMRLEAAKAALDGVVPGPPRAREAGDRPNGAASSHDTSAPGNGQPSRDRLRGTGSRREQALEVVQANPGITIPEIARIIGIQQNYLYRVLPTLVEDHLVEKRGRGWHLVAGG